MDELLRARAGREQAHGMPAPCRRCRQRPPPARGSRRSAGSFAPPSRATSCRPHQRLEWPLAGAKGWPELGVGRRNEIGTEQKAQQRCVSRLNANCLEPAITTSRLAAAHWSNTGHIVHHSRTEEVVKAIEEVRPRQARRGTSYRSGPQAAQVGAPDTRARHRVIPGRKLSRSSQQATRSTDLACWEVGAGCRRGSRHRCQ
jgi:hypothetical protein